MANNEVKYLLLADHKQMVAAFQEALNSAGKFEGKVNDATDSLENMGRQGALSGENIAATFKRIAGISGVGYLFKELSKQVVKVTGEIQQISIAFESMLGSAESAEKLMSQMVDTAAKTPFDLTSLAQGAKQLLAYGTSAENVNETLVRLGDIASGLSVPLNDLVYLYGTTMVQGRLFTQDVKHFQARGIPLLQELSKSLGKTTDEISNMVTEGRIGFSELEKVITSMTSEGGKFYNLMEKQSASITGQMANLGDSVTMMFNDIGKASEGAISGTIKGAQYLVEHYQQITKILGVLVVSYGAYRTAVMLSSSMVKGLTVVEHLHYTALVLQEKAQKLLNAAMNANPYVLVATLIAGLVTSYMLFRDTTTEAEKAQKRLSDRMNEFNTKLEERRAKVEQLISVVRDETETDFQRLKALEDLKAIMPGVFNAYTVQKLATEDLTRVTKELNAVDSTAGIEEQKRAYEEATESIAKYTKQIEELVKVSKFGDAVDRSATAEQIKYFQRLLKKVTEDAKVAKAELDRLLQIEWKATTPKEVQKAMLEQALAEFEKQRNTLMEAQKSRPLSIIEIQDLEGAKIEIVNIRKELKGLAEDSVLATTKNKAYWEKEKKEYEEIRDALDPDDKATRAQWDAAVAGVAKCTAALEKFNTVKASKDATDAAKKAAEDAKKEAKAYAKAMETRVKVDRDLGKAMIDIEQKTQAAITGAMKEGEEKRLKLLDDELNQQLQEIEEWRENILKTLNEGRDADDLELIKELPEHIGEAIDAYEELIIKAINARKEMTDPDSLKNLEQKYFSLSRSLREIDERYAQDEAVIRKQMLTASAQEYKEYSEMLVDMEKKKQEEISAVVSKGLLEGKDFKVLFGDLEAISTATIRTAVENAKKLLENSENLTIEDTKHLQEIIAKGEAAIAKNNPFEALGTAYKNYKEALKNGGTGEKEWGDVVRAAESVKATLSEVGSTLNEVVLLFGKDFSQAINKVIGGVNSAITAFEVFGKKGKKDTAEMIKGVQGFIGVLTTVIGTMMEAMQACNTLMSPQAQTNALIIENIRKVKNELDTLFTVDYVNKMKNLNEALLKGTQNILSQLYAMSTYYDPGRSGLDKFADWLFGGKKGAGKIKEIFDALNIVVNKGIGDLKKEFNTYFDWFDGFDNYFNSLKIGESFNIPKLNDVYKAIAEIDVILSGKLSKTEKDLATAAKTSLESIKETLEEIQNTTKELVGDLFGALQSKFIEMYKAGQDAFGKYDTSGIRQSLAEIAQQMVVNIQMTKLFASEFDALGDALADAIAAGDMSMITNSFSKFFDDIEAKIPGFSAAMQEFERISRERGFDPFSRNKPEDADNYVRGSVADIDNQISKLREQQRTQATTFEERERYEKEINALLELRNQLTREDQRAQEGSIAYHRARVLEMEKELELIQDQSSEEFKRLKAAWEAEKAILAEKEKQLLTTPAPNTLAGIQARLNELKAYRESLTEEQTAEIAAVNAAIDEAEAAYNRLERILGISREQQGPTPVDDLIEGTLAYWEKIESEANERLRHLRAEQVDEINEQLKLIREAREEKEKINAIINAPDAEKQMLDDLNKKYETMLQKRARLTEEYNKEIALLTKMGLDEQADLARQARDKELSDLEQSVIVMSEAWIALTEEMEDINVNMARAMIAEVRRTLADTTGLTDEARKKFEKQLAKMEKQLDDAERSINEHRYDEAIKNLNDVAAVINSVTSGLKELGFISDDTLTSINRIGNILSGATGILSGIASGNWVSVIQGGVNVAVNLYKMLDFETRRIDRAQKDTAASLDRITAAYNRLQREVQISVGLDTYQKQREQLENLALQQLTLTKQIASEKDRKKPDQSVIRAWEEEWQRIEDSKIGIISSMRQSLLQTDVKAAAQELNEILFSTFGSMQDMMDATVDYAGKSVQKMLRQYVQLAMIEKPLKALQDSLSAELEETSGLPTREMMERYTKELKTIMENARKGMEPLADLLRDEMFDSQLLNAVKGMSEQTANALVGLGNASYQALIDTLLVAREHLSTAGQMLDLDREIARDIAKIKDFTAYIPRIYDMIKSWPGSDPLKNRGF